MKLLYVLVVLFFITNSLFSQEIPDFNVENKCELFAQKVTLNKKDRLASIDSLQGTLVTVFVLDDEGKVEKSYTGTVKKMDNSQINKGGTMLIVEVDKGNGMKGVNFPLTNDKSFRIYSTSCLSGED